MATVTIRASAAVGHGATIKISVCGEMTIAWYERHYKGSYFTVVSDTVDGEPTWARF